MNRHALLSPMFDLPPHPGSLIRRLCIEANGLTVTDAADILNVTRQALNNLVNGNAGVSPEMALRLEAAFGRRARAWMLLQMDYDLAAARLRSTPTEIRRYVARAKATQRLALFD